MSIFPKFLFPNFHLQNMSKTSKAYSQNIDLDDLDLKRTFTLEEFKYINSQLKNHILKIDGQPVNLFELDENGKLTPMRLCHKHHTLEKRWLQKLLVN